MLASLWRNREHPTVFSERWFRGWAKRIWSFPAVLGCEVRAFNLRQRGAHICDDPFLVRVCFQVHDRVTIGRRVCINDDATILSASHHVDDPAWSSFSKPVIIEDYVWIGVGALVLPGVRIGRGAVIGAGAVVSRDIPPFSVDTRHP